MSPASRLRLHGKADGHAGKAGMASDRHSKRCLGGATEQVRLTAVAVVSGHGTREKTVEITGIDTVTIESALAKEAAR